MAQETLEEVLLPGVSMFDYLDAFSSPMIVHDLYVFRAAFIPPEDDPPLLVDSDAMHPSEVAAQLLQSVAWWRPQILDRRSSVQQIQFA